MKYRKKEIQSILTVDYSVSYNKITQEYKWILNIVLNMYVFVINMHQSVRWFGIITMIDTPIT